MKHSALISATAIALLTTFGVEAAAQGKKTTVPTNQPPAQSAPANQDQKLDVTDLEQRYWAAKDTDFSVVQNRLYSKAGRFSLYAAYGALINDSWSDGSTIGLGGNYYLSERIGVELTAAITNSKNNQALDNLISQSGFADHGKIKGYYGAAFNWVPFYAKMSFLNSKIIYFDMSISPGLGLTQYEQQKEAGNVMKSAPTFSLDISQHFFLTNWFALRFSFQNRWFSEEVVKYRISSQNLPSSTGISRTSIILFGANIYF